MNSTMRLSLGRVLAGIHVKELVCTYTDREGCKLKLVFLKCVIWMSDGGLQTVFCPCSIHFFPLCLFCLPPDRTL